MAQTIAMGTLAIDLDRRATPNEVVIATSLNLGPSSTLALTGAITNSIVPLIRFTGTRTGSFGTVTGLPQKYVVRYGAASNSSIYLEPAKGTILIIR